MSLNWPHSTKDGLILSSSQGVSQTQTVYWADSNIPQSNDYTQGKMDGCDSYFVVYSVPNYNNANDPTAYTLTAVVDSKKTTEFGFTAQSAQGFDKDGITIFEHYWFGGNAKSYTSSTADITEDFPVGEIPGASSFIITKGWWSLYTQKNFEGIITLNAGTRFGPGTRFSGLPKPEYNDQVQSIQCFDTPN